MASVVYLWNNGCIIKLACLLGDSNTVELKSRVR